MLLCGYPPFNGGSEFLTYDLVKAGEVVFPSPSWDHISEGAISFVKRLLVLDPEQRPSASQALEDPWLKQEKVQPYGLAWAASFIPKRSRYASDVEDHHSVKHVDEEKRSMFASFMEHVKVSKTLWFRFSCFRSQKCIGIFPDTFIMHSHHISWTPILVRQTKKADAHRSSTSTI